MAGGAARRGFDLSGLDAENRVLIAETLGQGSAVAEGPKGPARDEIAAQLGVSASSLAQTLLVATLGDAEANLAKFNAGDEQIPIVVRLNAAARDDLQQIQSLRVPSAAGQVPLAVVADVTLSAGPTQIERYDRRYRTSVTANLADGAVLGPVDAQVKALQDTMKLPPGTALATTEEVAETARRRIADIPEIERLLQVSADWF